VVVSVSQQVATQDLLTANGLNYTLSILPSSGTLCIRNQCMVYVLAAGDTCHSIYISKGVSQAKLLSWNAFINGYYDNIANFTGQTIFVFNPLGDYLVENNTDTGYNTEPATVPTDVAPQTNTNCGLYYDTVKGDDCGVVTINYSISIDDFIFLNPMKRSYEMTPDTSVVTNLPYYDPWADDPDAIVIPLAKDTRTDCWYYIWWNATLSSPIGCWELAIQSEITREQLVVWNPSLDQNGDDPDATKTYNYDCTIAPSVSYCLELASPTPYVPQTAPPVSPRAAGEIEGCTKWFRSALSCESHLSMLRISQADFYRFNPSLGADCSKFVLGTYYCYSTNEDGSSPERPGTTGAATLTTPSPTPTFTPGGVVTPMPTQDGMVSGCTSFYNVIRGDGCWAIANSHGISLDDLYAWNPALNGDCSGLYPDKYICVGRAPVATAAAGSSTSNAATTTRASTSATAPAATSNKISPDGLCGRTNGYTCTGSTFGSCCSEYGYCGNTASYCSACQVGFGSCSK
jgi:hypothetical protein